LLEWFATHSAAAYAAIYFGVILLMALAEDAWPRRRHKTAPLRSRWLGNFGVAVVSGAIGWLLYPSVTFMAAWMAAAHGFGLLGQVAVPWPVALLLTFVWLDLLRYLQHRLLHSDLLWRVHRLHHTDLDCDFTTGLRFHPIEGAIAAFTGFAGVLALGAPLGAVVAAELGFVAMTMLTHANIAVPRRLDAALRLVLVTPDLHRVHHGRTGDDSRHNYGVVLSVWDRLFGTLRERPLAEQERMPLGVEGFEGERCVSLPWLLADPFIEPEVPAGSYPGEPGRSRRA
jgi:sterol desaturase/sphingolipid hydroxylase (fatty acid hydroxylase superfamily)